MIFTEKTLAWHLLGTWKSLENHLQSLDNRFTQHNIRKWHLTDTCPTLARHLLGTVKITWKSLVITCNHLIICLRFNNVQTTLDRHLTDTCLTLDFTWSMLIKVDIGLIMLVYCWNDTCLTLARHWKDTCLTLARHLKNTLKKHEKNMQKPYKQFKKNKIKKKKEKPSERENRRKRVKP